jgi:hypothetical protein
MAAMARPKGTCAYCATDGVEIEGEHVFPESWYPDGYSRLLMLIVPSCRTCNDGFNRVEQRLFLPFMMSLPPDPRMAGLTEQAIRSAETNAGTVPTPRRAPSAIGDGFRASRCARSCMRGSR